MTNPELVGNSSTAFIPYFRNDAHYNITTQGQTIAVQLAGSESYNDGTQFDASVVSQYVRIQFFQATVNDDSEQNSSDLTAVPGILCREFFADEIEAE